MGIFDRILGRGKDDQQDQNPTESIEDEELDWEMPDEGNESPEEEETEQFYGVGVDRLEGTDEDLHEMSPDEREEYLMNQDFSDIRWLTENTESTAVPEVFGQAYKRDVNLSEIEEKALDPEFWSGNPEAKQQLETAIEDADSIDREEIVSQIGSKDFQRDSDYEFENIVSTLFENGQYEGAAQFAEFADANYHFAPKEETLTGESDEPISALAYMVGERLLDETEGEALHRIDPDWKDLFAMTTSAADIKRGEIAGIPADGYSDDEPKAEKSAVFDSDPYSERREASQDIEGKLSVRGHDWTRFADGEVNEYGSSSDHEDAKDEAGAFDKVSVASFQMQNGKDYSERAVEAVNELKDVDNYEQAALTAARFELDEEMSQVVEDSDPEDIYHLAKSVEEIDGDIGYGEELTEGVGKYVDDLVKEEGDLEEASRVASEFEGVEEYLGPDTRIELRKAQS